MAAGVANMLQHAGDRRAIDRQAGFPAEDEIVSILAIRSKRCDILNQPGATFYERQQSERWEC
jgi:hypothetical protein